MLLPEELPAGVQKKLKLCGNVIYIKDKLRGLWHN